jgi:hypothetical protein
MKPFRAPRQVIKETQEAEMDNIGRDIVGHGERWTIVAQHERSESLDGLSVSHELSQVPSPSLFPFEDFLGKIKIHVRTYPKDGYVESIGRKTRSFQGQGSSVCHRRILVKCFGEGKGTV